MLLIVLITCRKAEVIGAKGSAFDSQNAQPTDDDISIPTPGLLQTPGYVASCQNTGAKGTNQRKRLLEISPGNTI